MPAPVKQPRLVPRKGNPAIRRIHLNTRWWQDLYHNALTMRWSTFMLWGVTLYIGVNALFAVLYLLQPGAIQNAAPGSFADAFFFSVQCISTIGFGNLLPATLYANILVTAEAILSLAIVALATGSVFARISRPQARVLFAQHPVIARHNGVPTLSIRIANERRSQILAAEVRVTVLRRERTEEGAEFRRFYDLDLARARTPVFAMTFTVMHSLIETSPLYGYTPEMMDAEDMELLISVTGLEEVTSQTVHARYAYPAHEILWGRRYRDIFKIDATGDQTIDYSEFHVTDPAVVT